MKLSYGFKYEIERKGNDGNILMTPNDSLDTSNLHLIMHRNLYIDSQYTSASSSLATAQRPHMLSLYHQLEKFEFLA